jgi:hypothetical protein
VTVSPCLGLGRPFTIASAPPTQRRHPIALGTRSVCRRPDRPCRGSTWCRRAEGLGRIVDARLSCRRFASLPHRQEAASSCVLASDESASAIHPRNSRERPLGEPALDECHEVLSVLVLAGGLLSAEHGSAPLLACAWTGVASRRPPLGGLH